MDFNQLGKFALERSLTMGEGAVGSGERSVKAGRSAAPESAVGEDAPAGNESKPVGRNASNQLGKPSSKL
jgi:hypothetical protein